MTSQIGAAKELASMKFEMRLDFSLFSSLNLNFV